MNDQPNGQPTNQPNRPPTDYRATRRKSDRNLALAVVIFLVGVGGTAIALVYGGARPRWG